MNLIIKALHTKYEAQKAAAIAELSLLLNSSVGLPQHSNIIDEADLKIQAISKAEGSIRILQELLSAAPAAPEKNEE